MDLPGIVWMFGGVIAGNAFFAILSTWFRAVLEVRKAHQSGNPWAMVAATSLFNAGPWALIGAGIFTYYEISAPWAPWFFGGAFAWISLLLFTVALASKARLAGKKR